MSYEVHAHSEWRMPIGRRKKDERRFIDDIVNADQLSEVFFRVQLLAQALVTENKDYARMGERPDRPAQGLRKMVEEKTLDRFFALQLSSYLDSGALNLLPTLPDLRLFPSNAWAIKTDFTLRKPYLSRDDTEFYILDNPVRKEWVFKVPYVAPSQWKGALRAAMRQLRGYITWEQESRDEQMIRLFGNVKGEEVEFSAGWLHFYPTYFTKIGLEVINPHSRETGAGERPIHFECVPAGSDDDPTRGSFTLLYVPLGEVREEVCEQEMKADFRAVAQGLKAMFTQYGFGAKTSSGLGRANVQWEEAEVQPNNLREEWEKIWKDG